MPRFIILWLGQTVSIFGSGLTAFALGVWVYRETGSVTRFALITFFTLLPGILFSPVAGALVDRWDRRRTVILADTGAGLVTAVIAILIFSEHLEIWHLYGLLALASLFNSLQFPAFTALTTLLVGKENLGRAAGMTQLGQATGMVLAPLFAPLFWTHLGLSGVMLIDVATFLAAVTTLLVVRIPRPERAPGGRERASLVAEAAFGWTYIRRSPGLFGLLVLFACGNLVMGFIQVLITPLVLGMSSATVLGRVLALAGLGMVVGGIAMSVSGGPRHRVRGILAVTALQGLVLFAGAPVRHVAGIAVVAAVFMLGGPIVMGASQAIWQSKVEPELQGRVFAIRRMIAMLSLPVAFLAAGPISDHLFEPWLAPGGPLAASVGRIYGTGPGRGIALLVSGLGLFLVLSSVLACFYGPLRRLEAELPDVIPDSREEEGA